MFSPLSNASVKKSATSKKSSKKVDIQKDDDEITEE
jgi:hypothetical protein